MQSKHYICENLVRRFQPRFGRFLKSFWFWCESTLLCCWLFGEICKYWVGNPLESSVPRIIRLLCVLEVQVQPEKKNNINDGWERNKIELIYQSFWISNTTQQGCLGLCTKATRSDGWLVLCLVSLNRFFLKLLVFEKMDITSIFHTIACTNNRAALWCLWCSGGLSINRKAA